MTVTEIYETFTGRPPRSKRRLQLPPGADVPAHLAQLGILEEIRGTIKTGPREFLYILQIPRKDKALLLATAAGTLYVYDPAGAFTHVSEIRSVTYYADKHTDGAASYYHDFKAPLPRLEVMKNTNGKVARFTGGRYEVEERGIVG